MNLIKRITTILFCCLLLVPHIARADWHRTEAAIMGTAVTVELWHTDEKAGKALLDAVLVEMRRIDALMSTWKPDSQLSRINATAARKPAAVGSELRALIIRALGFSGLTGGAFDITYASAGRHYEDRNGNRPSEAEIAEALPAIDYRHVIIDPEHSTVRYRHPGVSIDLGGIAKGHAVDRAMNILQRAGVEHALVSAGGDTRVIGNRWGRAWQVGIRDPRNDDGIVTMIPLVNRAISTSGDYERYFEEDGVRYHHILNPGTGKSVGDVRSVTVIGNTATTTDALSTSVFVLGVGKGLQLVNRQADIEAVIIDNEGRMHFSSGLAMVQ